MRFFRSSGIFIFLIFLPFCSVLADRGVSVSSREDRSDSRWALIIGNADYKVGRLRNPANDAHDMAVVLRTKGFNVTLLTDASRKQMKKAIKAFGHNLRKGGIGLFFYAGHGMQVKGVNYLIPIGAEIEEEDEIEYEAVDSNLVLSKMDSAGNRLNMVFLDACRDNPFASSFRSSKKGLATMDAPSGTLVAFATAPGRTAADGSGRNGLFTGHLIRQMKQPGVPLTRMMMEVRKAVIRDSSKKQVPWDVSSLTGDFYFSGKGNSQFASRIPPADRQTGTINAEDEFWNDIRRSTSIPDYEDYLDAYPNGRYKRLAESRIRRLMRKQSNRQPGSRNRSLVAVVTSSPGWDTSSIFKLSDVEAIFLNHLQAITNQKGFRTIDFRYAANSLASDSSIKSHFKEISEKTFLDIASCSGTDKRTTCLKPHFRGLIMLRDMAGVVIEINLKSLTKSEMDSTSMMILNVGVHARDIISGNFVASTVVQVARRGGPNSTDHAMFTALIGDACDNMNKEVLPDVLRNLPGDR